MIMALGELELLLSAVRDLISTHTFNQKWLAEKDDAENTIVIRSIVCGIVDCSNIIQIKQEHRQLEDEKPQPDFSPSKHVEQSPLTLTQENVKLDE